MEEKIVFDESFDRAEFAPVDTGDYECVLKADKRVSKDGTKTYLNIDMKIRDDVNQNFKGRHVFGSIWPDKNRPTWFDLIKLNKLVKTQKGLPGYKYEFSDVDECILFLNGINLRVTIEKKYDDVQGKDVNSIDFYTCAPSTAGSLTIEEPKTMVDDELPF